MAEVDDHFSPIPGTEVTFECDTLLLSVGLIPENELSRGAGIVIDERTKGAVVFENMETSIPGIFACGNVVQVHDLADNVAMEAERAARGAADYIKGIDKGEEILISCERPLTYTVPQKVHKDISEKFITLMFRVNQQIEEKAFVYRNENNEKLGQQKSGFIRIGEMVKLIIPKKVLSQCDKELHVSVEEVEA